MLRMFSSAELLLQSALCDVIEGLFPSMVIFSRQAASTRAGASVAIWKAGAEPEVYNCTARTKYVFHPSGSGSIPFKPFLFCFQGISKEICFWLWSKVDRSQWSGCSLFFSASDCSYSYVFFTAPHEGLFHEQGPVLLDLQKDQSKHLNASHARRRLIWFIITLGQPWLLATMEAKVVWQQHH